MPKNEIPKQIDEFTDIMHKIFGLGASRLEIKFMKNLHSKIKVSIELNEYEWPLSEWIVEDVSFTEYVHDMRVNYCNLR
jgi:serine protease inhibitor